MIEPLAMEYMGRSGHTVRIARFVAVARTLRHRDCEAWWAQFEGMQPPLGIEPRTFSLQD